MKLTKKASTFLDGIRRPRTSRPSRKEPATDNANHQVKSRRGATATAVERRQSRRVAVRAGATTSRKRTRSMGQQAIHIHEDDDSLVKNQHKRGGMDVQDHIQLVSDDEEVRSSDDTTSEHSSSSEDEVDESVVEDMRKLEESFEGISRKYRLINRIGEGTFSTVYKAEQLIDEDETDAENEMPFAETDPNIDAPAAKRRRVATTSSQSTLNRQQRKPQFVALKKIYVTSSPARIANELELLHILRDSAHICPLLTAFRHLDQVVAVLPYFRHLDFRLYYRDFLVNDMRHYFKSLLSALHSVHRAGILHRDIKPTNFLYDHAKRQGVLVDFGLAEKQGTDWQPCLCQENKEKRKDRIVNSYAYRLLQTQPGEASTGYPKSDPRPSRRANRAGTRGFRAPEVLLKCPSQTTKIDIWSVGVILLTLLARRFPFFNSADDVDAMIELASIFGRRKMKAAAAMHGSVFETNIETIGESGFSLERIILWATCRTGNDEKLRVGESQAVRFLTTLLELDPSKRMTAREALHHEFFTAPVEDSEEKAEREAQELAEENAAVQR